MQNTLRSDASFLQYKISCERRKVERLQHSLQLLTAGGQHTFFVDSKRELHRFDLSKRLDTLPQLLDRPFNRRTVAQLEAQPVLAGDGKATEDGAVVAATRERKRSLAELAERQERLKKLEEEWRQRQEKLKLVVSRQIPALKKKADNSES